jgi:hypothetical protein
MGWMKIYTIGFTNKKAQDFFEKLRAADWLFRRTSPPDDSMGEVVLFQEIEAAASRAFLRGRGL